jgi:hypothetical protein
MVGVEFAVAVFVNPILTARQRDLAARMSHATWRILMANHLACGRAGEEMPRL